MWTSTNTKCNRWCTTYIHRPGAGEARQIQNAYALSIQLNVGVILLSPSAFFYSSIACMIIFCYGWKIIHFEGEWGVGMSKWLLYFMGGSRAKSQYYTSPLRGEEGIWVFEPFPNLTFIFRKKQGRAKNWMLLGARCPWCPLRATISSAPEIIVMAMMTALVAVVIIIMMIILPLITNRDLQWWWIHDDDNDDDDDDDATNVRRRFLSKPDMNQA